MNSGSGSNGPTFTFDPTIEIEKCAIVLRGQNWIIPPYFQGGWVDTLVDIIDAAPEGKKHDILAVYLSNMYTPEYISSMYLYRYKAVPPIKDFSEIISEGVQAFYAGLVQAAVTTLVPVIEGITERMAAREGVVTSSQKAKMRKPIEILIDRFQQSNPYNHELIVMLKTYWLFIDQDMFMSTTGFSGVGNLNRHGILHGIFADHQYEHEYNFYKLISVIDFLTFVNTGLTGAASFFAPEDTPESFALAAYYKSLRLCSVARNLLKI